MIKVVVLDIDNTLLSFSGYVKESMRNGFAEFGLPAYNETMFTVFEKINNGLWKQIEQGTLTHEGLMEIRWNLIFDALGIDFDGVVFEKYFREQLFNNAVLEPGAKELLDYLGKKYLLCVASNGPYEQQINRLRVGEIYNYFSEFFISSAVGAQKPTFAFFDFCFDALRKKISDLLPEEIMIIGDSVSADISGGKAYGMKTCLYTSKDLKTMDVPDADYIVNDLLQITQIL